MRLFSLPPRRLWTGVLLALLAGGWFAPVAVRAGCGDYVAIPGEARNHSMPQTNESSPNVPSQPQPFSPCTSAACLPPGDMALAGAVVSTEIDQWAWGHQHLDFLPIERDRLPIFEDIQRLQGPDSSIFHPPRTSMN